MNEAGGIKRNLSMVIVYVRKITICLITMKKFILLVVDISCTATTVL